MIALVNPISRGVFLSAAIRERGEECALVYDGHFAAAAEDGGPGRRVVHRDVHSTARVLRGCVSGTSFPGARPASTSPIASPSTWTFRAMTTRRPRRGVTRRGW